MLVETEIATPTLRILVGPQSSELGPRQHSSAPLGSPTRKTCPLLSL